MIVPAPTVCTFESVRLLAIIEASYGTTWAFNRTVRKVVDRRNAKKYRDRLSTFMEDGGIELAPNHVVYTTEGGTVIVRDT